MLGTSDAVMSACFAAATAGGWNPATCNTFKSTGLKISGVTQSGQVTQMTQCTLDDHVISQLQASLTDQINQQLSKTTDGITSSLKSFINASQNTTDKTLNTTTVSNFVNQTFKLNAVQTAVNTVAAAQKQVVTAGNADDSTVKNVSQTVQLEAILKLLQSNDATSNAIAKLDNQGTQSLTTTERGIADIFSSLMSTIQGVLGGYIWAVFGCVALVAICCMVVCALTLFTGKDIAKDPGAQKTLVELAKTVK